MSKMTRAELVAAVEAHTAELAKIEARREMLMHARRLALRELSTEHGVSLRELGKLARMSAPAVQQNLRALDAPRATATAKG